MSDVFISYASEDRNEAAKLASALDALGWSVWWDRKIITGQTFDLAIERELESAKSVIVLWSKNSIMSEWVKNEAAVASERGVLLPAIIESVRLPLEFRRKQTADLTDWKGEPSHHGFQALREGISATMGATPQRQPGPDQVQKMRWNFRWVLTGLATLAIAVGLGVYLTGTWRNSMPGNDPLNMAAGLADVAAGTYFGEVIADSKGSSRSDVVLTITKLDRSTVRVTSDYRRLGTIDITLTQTGQQILNADGDTPLLLELDTDPPELTYDPHGELAYRGYKRR